MNVALYLEIKSEYTEHLVDTLTPYIYEGLTSIYKDASKLAEENNCKDKTLMIFQKLLQSVSGWSEQRITDETIRIKQLSGTMEYFDDLVRAVIKSNIILLTYSNNISNVIAQTFYNNMSSSTLIHKCYMECAKDSHNNPYLFFHELAPVEYKRNQVLIQQNIQSGIVKAIRKVLPLSLILTEYLANSVDIIKEPAKVELVGLNQTNPTPPQWAPPMIPNNNLPINALDLHAKYDVPNVLPPQNKNIDPNLEKEVMQIIKTEQKQDDKNKIQAIMNINKLLTSVDHKQSERKNFISQEHPGNKKLSHSDKELININFDDESTIVSNQKTVSKTSISQKPMPKNIPITSEKVDPSKIIAIEDYGSGVAKQNDLLMSQQVNLQRGGTYKNKIKH